MKKILLLAVAVATLALGAQAQFPTPGGQPEMPALKPGDRAPLMSIAKWMKGEPIKDFDKGKVYVMGFVKPLPQLNPLVGRYAFLQETYGEKGLTVMMVASRDDRFPTTEESYAKWVEGFGDELKVRMAWDDYTKTEMSFLQRAKSQSLIDCFVVDKEQKIAYIGNPFYIEYAIEKCLEGAWTVELAKKLKDAENLVSAAQSKASYDKKGALADLDKLEKESPEIHHYLRGTHFQFMVDAGAYDRVVALGKVLGEEAIEKKDSSTLNLVAWTIVDPEQKWEKRDLELAGKLAEKAVEFSKTTDKANQGAILDTLARVHFWKGELDEAIELQKKACEMAKGSPSSGSLEETLAEYEKKKAAAGSEEKQPAEEKPAGDGSKG